MIQEVYEILIYIYSAGKFNMMSVKICFIFIFVIMVIAEAQLSYKGGNCPMKTTVHKCTPRCVSDYQCGSNEKCCTNICGSQSCVQPSAVSSGNDNGYKESHRDNAVYCGGIKCGPYQKCEFDRNTKREKCVRS